MGVGGPNPVERLTAVGRLARQFELCVVVDGCYKAAAVHRVVVPYHHADLAVANHVTHVVAQVPSRGSATPVDRPPRQTACASRHGKGSPGREYVRSQACCTV
jgi:hypothetical protein